MYQLSVQTADGELLTMTGKEPIYQVTNIVGLNPPKAQINTTAIAGMDGAIFNSSKLNTRNIVITCKINGDVEKNRLNLYRYFRTKEFVRVYYSNDTLDVYIDGYVDTVECGLFAKSETAQISIICPYPYFRSVSQKIVDSSHSVGAFTFPWYINAGAPVVISTYDSSDAINAYNETDSTADAEIEIYLDTDCASVELKNASTDADFRLDYPFLAGDTIYISSASKRVTLLRGDERVNLMPYLTIGSRFFRLAVGNNLIYYLIDGAVSNAAYIVIVYNDNYRGV